MKTYTPEQVDIVWMNLDPSLRHEQKVRRPAFVLTRKIFNRARNLVLICPITSKSKGYPFQIEFNSKKVEGVIMIDQIRSVDWQNRKIEFIEKTDKSIILNVKKVPTSLIE
ncbi:MAG: mRNA interferase MazF [Candidatus Paceibacteria bacterium]|jgi:mRNA interferase MazF